MTTTILASFPSPSQGVWHLGPIPIRAYALCILIGVIAALFIGDRRWAERGGERGTVFDIALWAIILGLIGGRLYHVLTDWQTYFGPGGAGFWAAFKIQEGGLGIWGAVALGGVGAWIGCRRRGIPLPAFGDAIAPGIILAQAIGRIGNYFNQELFGRDTTLPWGLQIFERVDADGAINYLNGVSTGRVVQVVHPTFLYELLWNLLVFALLIWVDRRYRIGHGRLFALYVAAYCFGRFWIELMRSDVATHIAGIRINSFVSVFVFIGAVVYIMVAPKGREDPSELRGDADEVKHDESAAEAVTKELAAVAATTGVVAAAKVAGEKEDEDTAAEAEADADATEAIATDANANSAEEPEAEPVAETEQLTKDVAEAPAEDIGEADAFAEAGEEAEQAEDVGGVGAVEGEDATAAEEAAPEVHEAAVEAAEEAAAAADEIAGEDAAEPEKAESASEESDEKPDKAAEASEESVDDAEDDREDVGGVGAVDGDEVAEAEEAAPEVHGAAVEGAEEAASVADEVTDEDSHEDADGVGGEEADGDAGEEAEASEESTGNTDDEPEDVGGVGAVEGEEAAEAEEAATEVHEAAVEAADEAASVTDEVAGEHADEPDKTP